MIAQPTVPTIPERKIHTVRVLDSQRLTPTAHLIRATRPDDFAFRASSFVRLTLKTAQGVEARPMSIASSPTRNHLDWIVRVSSSEWKNAFTSLQPGDEIQIEGPRGNFFLDSARPAVMIAGGIGITPFKSMLEYAADAQLATPLTLVYSSKTPDEIVCNDDLAALAQKNPHVQIIHTITRHTLDQNWNGRIGRIDLDLLREISEKQPDALYYICGTPAIVHATIEMLRALGITDDRILQEQFKGYARHHAVTPLS
jgi:ferredoxin-NADP reductase